MLSSLGDIANSVQSGLIDLIDAVSIGDLTLSALLGVSGSDSMTITEYSVAAGYDKTRAAIRNAQTRSLTILLADPEISLEAGFEAVVTGSAAGFTDSWRDKVKTLYEMFLTKSIVEYQTHEGLYPPSMIREITPLWDNQDNQDCFVGVVTMREIQQVELIMGTGIYDSPWSDGGLM